MRCGIAPPGGESNRARFGDGDAELAFDGGGLFRFEFPIVSLAVESLGECVVGGVRMCVERGTLRAH